MTRAEIGRGSRFRFRLFTLALLIWAAVLTAIAVTVIPDAYWFSYYSVDYSLGFVRRGLAGELVGLFPEDSYFQALKVLRWVPTAFFVIGLAALAWTVRSASGRSERRLLMCLIVPLLPFGFAFGLFSARPDLLGASALIVFAVALKSAQRDRSVMAASAVYGGTLAVLTLTHEAIPFLFGLGTLTALAVLAHRSAPRILRVSAMLAVFPGLATALTVAVLGRRGISEQLCELVPRGPTNHPLAGNPSLGQLLRGFRFEVDYRDWLCRNITPLYDQSFSDATRFVASIGVVGLTASTVLGIALLWVTIWAVSCISGVRFGRMWALLRTRISWALFGLALFLPIFMTGVDWTRWWVMITLDIGVVFLLFASGEPESEVSPTRRTLTVFAIGSVLFATLPLGIVPGFGAPVPM